MNTEVPPRQGQTQSPWLTQRQKAASRAHHPWDVEANFFDRGLDLWTHHMTNYWIGTHQNSYQDRYGNNVLTSNSTTTHIQASGNDIRIQRLKLLQVGTSPHTSALLFASLAESIPKSFKVRSVTIKNLADGYGSRHLTFAPRPSQLRLWGPGTSPSLAFPCPLPPGLQPAKHRASLPRSRVHYVQVFSSHQQAVKLVKLQTSSIASLFPEAILSPLNSAFVVAAAPSSSPQDIAPRLPQNTLLGSLVVVELAAVIVRDASELKLIFPSTLERVYGQPLLRSCAGPLLCLSYLGGSLSVCRGLASATARAWLATEGTVSVTVASEGNQNFVFWPNLLPFQASWDWRAMPGAVFGNVPTIGVALGATALPVTVTRQKIGNTTGGPLP
ncbi:hypothetical protein C8R46DRAFT_1027639 [Mycena filopes]|nr:hypothetical protein C8R46DRAFT_1027639 [Mycena filopes]